MSLSGHLSPFSKAFNRVFEAMDKGMAKFNIDATSCTQLYVCEAIKDSKRNAIIKGGYMDSLVKILIDSDWVMQEIKGSSVEDAIRLAKENGECEAFFNKCKLDTKFIKRPELLNET